MALPLMHAWLDVPLGDFIARFEWSQTALGALESWSTTLRTLAATVLRSRQPMMLLWGRELAQIYNDAYARGPGATTHPAALGRAAGSTWPHVECELRELVRRGMPFSFEERSGRTFWTYHCSPVVDDAGNVSGALILCTESSPAFLEEESRTTIVRMQHERDQLLRLFDQAPAAVCLLRGPDFTFEFANEQYVEFSGRNDLVGKPLLEVFPELRGQGFDELLWRVMSSNEPFIGREVRVPASRPRADGRTEAYCTFIYSPLRDASGRVEGVGVFAFDVTDQVLARREAEALARRLQKSEGELRSLAEAMPQLAWSTRPDGSVVWLNRRWHEYTGIAPEDVSQAVLLNLHDPERIEEVIENWRRGLEHGVPFEMEFLLRRADGQFRWHLTRAVPLRDDEGELLRWFGTTTDIHDSRLRDAERAQLLASAEEARETAEMASRAKDEFLTTASHELRTPLNAILGWARLLRGGELDQSAYLRGLEVIERNATAQVRLIEDILDGSRIITGKLRLEIRPLDLVQLVHTALEAVQPAADAKQISITTELHADAARVVGDPERLQQVVWNLTNNAIKFTPKGGSVCVRLCRSGTDIELEVKDSGQGIGADFVDHVFERFRQAEGSTTRRHGGLGLGLALVRHLVEAHGGTVRVESAGLGQGSTFRVNLPVQAVYAEPTLLARSSPMAEAVQAAAKLRLNGVRVLIVDDEDDARELVATVLRGAGAEVSTAGSAAEALDEMEKRVPHILLSDIGMPVVDGYALVQRVRTELGAAGASLPAVALTAYAREEDRRLAMAAGFNQHIAKPVEPAELLNILVGFAKSSEATRGPEQIDLRRADRFAKLSRVIQTTNTHEVLQFLNHRTPHRFTAIYRFDGDMLRSDHLFDAENPESPRGDDAPMVETYCSIVRRTERSFTTADTRTDDRLRAHPARDNVISYCGVLLRDSSGAPYGTLCHFDLIPCDISVREMPLLEAAARELSERFHPVAPSRLD